MGRVFLRGDLFCCADLTAFMHAFLQSRDEHEEKLQGQWRVGTAAQSADEGSFVAGSKPPSPSVAVAMELIKSLLLVAEAAPQETPTPDAATALVRRFSQASHQCILSTDLVPLAIFPAVESKH